jgi:signal transduction histidine kinase
MVNHRHNILIVDDSPFNITMLLEILDEKKYNVSVAGSGKEAFEWAKKIQPDLILLDIIMPDIDGIETCRKLKEEIATKNIPVIFLTARDNTEDIINGFDAGAVDYVLKPFNVAELTKRVETHLQLQKITNDYIKSDEHKKTLLRIMSHDLTNYIGSIKGLFQLIKEDNSNLTELGEYIDKSIDNSLDLMTFIRNSMAIEEKGLNLNAFFVRELIDESLYVLNSKFKSKNIKVKKVIDPDLKIIVERISFINSVINNILTNAIKFSRLGSEVEINASYENRLNKARISIKDHGIGMPKSLIEKIFDISEQTSRTGTSGEIGTGFGMPLVKKFVSEYGGQIEVRSVEEHENSMSHGTEFIILLESPGGYTSNN